MKILLLSVSIIFSINGFSQNYVALIENQVLKNATINPGKKIKHTSNSPEKTLGIWYDSIYDWQWDMVDSEWDVYSKLINFTYNQDNYLTSTEKQVFDGAVWTNEEKNTSTYDGNNNRTHSTYELWDGSAWFNSLVADFTYDTLNHMVTYLYTNWNGSSMINLSKGAYTYDLDTNMVNYVSQTFDGANWINEYRTLNSYDDYHHIMDEVLQYWDGSYWVNNSRTTYVYDLSGYLLNIMNEVWDGNYWVKLYKDDYVYDSYDNLTQDNYYLWSVDSTSWVYSKQTINTYTSSLSGPKIHTILTKDVDPDGTGVFFNSTLDMFDYNPNGLLINLTQQIFNVTEADWKNNVIADYTYDGNDFKESDKLMNYYEGALTGGDSLYYYYGIYDSGISELKTNASKSTVYPNPAQEKITISNKAGIVSLEINNLQGLQMYSNQTLNKKSSCEIDLSGYNRGVYFIKIDTGKGEEVVKIVVQ